MSQETSTNRIFLFFPPIGNSAHGIGGRRFGTRKPFEPGDGSMSSGNQPEEDSSARELPQSRQLDGISNDPGPGRPIRETEWTQAALHQGDCRGMQIGNCVILDRLGAGSEVMVFKARHRRLGFVVALKILPASVARDRMAATRLQREIEAIARLKHTNIVAVLEADEDRGIPFLVMEYVEGRDLDQLVRDRGPLPVGEAIDVLIQAARGLEAAHSHGIVHHNIKPSNLMLDSNGVVRVLDLSAARIMDASSPFAEPEGGRGSESGMSGILDYRAPEQAKDSLRADHRADIYSLGCTLYYLMTGREPFVGDTVLKQLMAHQQQPAPSLRARRPDAPSALEHAFQKMMAKRPEDRPDSMTAVIALLEACKMVAKAPAPATELPKPDRASSIFAQRNVEAAQSGGSDFNLDDLNLDVRSEVHLPPLPINPRQSRSKPVALPSSNPPRLASRTAVLIAIGAMGVLGAAFLRFVVFSGASATDLNQPSNAMSGPKSTLPSTDGNPKHPEGSHFIPQPEPIVQTIFDGKSSKGWMLTDRKRLPPESLQIDGLNPHRTNSYLIVYEQKVGDFVLDCDYKLSKGCNSGVFLRVGDLNDPVHTGIEVTLDDTTEAGIGDSGAFNGLVAPRNNAQKPAGQWNHLTITATGPVLAVSLNGTDVSQINLDQWTVPGKRPDGTDHKFKDIAIARLPRSGYLGFQNLRGDCWFKNIKMKAPRIPSTRRKTDPHGDLSTLSARSERQGFSRPL
jgi:serine/threonine protein kinase